MGIFEKVRKARAKTKAEIKAAKTRAKAEVKAASKAKARQAKLLAQQEHKLLKVEQKGLKARRKQELKLAKTELERRKAGKLNKAKVQRYVGVARMLTPILLPLAYKASTAAQEAFTASKARKHGLTSAEVSQFAGHGAGLKARIAGLRKTTDGVPRGFALDVDERLDELDKAVDNAEFMTPEQRRRVHRSISSDLDAVAGQIQEKLV